MKPPAKATRSSSAPHAGTATWNRIVRSTTAGEPNPIFRAAEGDLVRAMHTVRRVEDVAALMANDLEPAVLRLRPEVAGALAALRQEGALAAIVSGSGPTAFGVFRHRDEAEAAVAMIPGSFAASPV